MASVIIMSIIVCLTSTTGQDLLDESVLSRELFEDLLLQHYGMLKRSTRFAAGNLSKRIKESLKLAPYASIEVSYRNLMNVFLLGVTYTIVLLQFLVST